jgi:hypothetical protein
LVTVQAPGQNPGGSGLSASPGSTEKVRVVYAVSRECLHQRFRDTFSGAGASVERSHEKS